MTIFGHVVTKPIFVISAGNLSQWLLRLLTLPYEMTLDSNIYCGYIQDEEEHTHGFVIKRHDIWTIRREEQLLDI
jgi:hypothetical protein